MNRFTKRTVSAWLASMAMLWAAHAQAANSTYTWVGSTNDLTLSGNWNPVATPIGGDIGLFGVSSSYTPEVSAAKNFSIDLIKFTAGSPYNFFVKDSGSSLTFVGSSIGPIYGVQNNSGNTQTFSVFNLGQIVFKGRCSADSSLGTHTGHMNYAIGNTATFGTLTFKEDSLAGKAHIKVNNGLVLFQDDSTADKAIVDLVASNSTLQFNNSAGADKVTVNAQNSNAIIFNHESNGEDGTFNLSHANIFFNNHSSAGAATINLTAGSSVNFGDSSTAGIAIINTTATDVINLGQAGDVVFDALVRGSGTINKTGSGKANYLSDNSAFAGTTQIHAGNFALNNTLGGNVRVNAGGTLSGIGTILGDLTAANGSFVAPGNGIGTMSVASNYIQVPHSTYVVQVDGSGNASKLLVGGQSSLNIGSNILVAPSVVQLAPNKSFTAPVLISETGVSGTFSNIASTNPLISLTLSYDPNDVFLTWTNSFAVMSTTPNQRKVTNRLQVLSHPSPENEAVLASLASQSKRQQRRALNQLTAQPYANLLLTAEVTNHKFIRRLYNPLRLLVTSHPCCVPDSCYLNNCFVDTWFDAGWDRSNFRGNRNARGFSLKGFEISLGSQMTIDHCWTVGIAGCYERDHIHYKVGGKGTSNAYLGALYTLFRPADFYVLGNLVGGYTQTKLKRHIDFGPFHFSNRGKPDIYQGSVYVEAGQDFGVDCFLLQPFVGIEAGYFRHDQFHERGQNLFSVDVKNKTYGTASSRLGMHFLTEFSCFKLFVDGAWQYRLTSLHNRSKERFQKFGDDFRIIGIPFAHSSFDGAINLSATVVDGWEIYAEAQGQWWKNASTFSLLGGLVIAW